VAPAWRAERFDEPPPLDGPADAVERMRHRVKSRAGRASYGKRKQNLEPVFGIIKAGCASGNSLLRGIEAVRGEWSLDDDGLKHPPDGGAEGLKTGSGSIRPSSFHRI
jgi:hypothetical protein